MATEVTITGKTAKGREEIKKYLAGGKLTQRQAILGKCYDCCGGYADGKVDCGIPDCTLYPYMPFGKAWKGRVKNHKQAEMAKKRFAGKKPAPESL